MFGWKKANVSNYIEAYNLYDGGLSTSPEILTFLHPLYDLNEKHYVRHNKERIAAAICVWHDQFLAGDPDAYHKNEGSIANINNISTSDFVDLYDELYFMRRNEHKNKQILAGVLNEIPSLKLGNILFYKNSPAAVQFVIKTNC
ncbi:hypothetical protein [Morganella psychrotolerans]|uniref:Uncharacterized protein n=1 Tax=Morganella psychrotolerans TaxID=368603 RepID=A0A1B8HEL4_9GAMM|nr:hypothetical protein [Morganella psychrotolerans]OBU07494.1 hypothetical protein AYY18_04465 [Morganella psychrotolerans]